MPYSISGPRNILLVDSDEAFGQVLKQVLGRDFFLEQATSTKQAIASVDSNEPDAILLNFDVPCESHRDGFAYLFHAVSERTIPVPVIAYSWDGRGQRAQEAVRAGASDVLEQPLDMQQLKFSLAQVCRRTQLLRELLDAHKLLGTPHIEGLLGNSKAMENVDQITRKVAEVFTTVLITGESGTGKGVVARAIHTMSPRSAKPFVAFSVCSFPDSLIDDELFGHERGAFTGAVQTRRGRFEEANGGTIFIDEIGDLALPLQAKLLRVLQERTVERLGSNVSRPVDVRVVCATHRNLEKMVEEGTFREDLYFRISVVKIQMPALRDRKEDIPLLAEHFLHNFAKGHNKAVRSFTPGFLSALCRHSWPGNVRELQNVMERSVVLANGNDQLGINDLPAELRALGTEVEEAPPRTFHEAVQNFKRDLVLGALDLSGGNKSKAAQDLGISRCYLHRLLNQLNLEPEESEDEEVMANVTPIQEHRIRIHREPMRLASAERVV